MIIRAETAGENVDREEREFTEERISAVKGADLDSIEVSKAGFVVGDPSGNPNVIIGLGSDDTIGITGINYCFYKKTQAAREQR